MAEANAWRRCSPTQKSTRSRLSVQRQLRATSLKLVLVTANVFRQTAAQEEIFGPVLNVMRADDLESAIETINYSPYGNGASIFTRSGKAAREFKHRVKAGMVGINIGVPASMAWFPFAGWGDSFFGDLHMQGREGVQFFTQQKVTTTRWFAEGEGNIWSTK